MQGAILSEFIFYTFTYFLAPKGNELALVRIKVKYLIFGTNTFHRHTSQPHNNLR